MKTMNQACTAVGNRDIEKFIPALITAMANPAEVSETVHKLSATTFVQAVEAPALSIMVPLLVRGLRERQTAIKRKSAVIIDNMSKLVDNPADAAVFLPRSAAGHCNFQTVLLTCSARVVYRSCYDVCYWS